VVAAVVAAVVVVKAGRGRTAYDGIIFFLSPWHEIRSPFGALELRLDEDERTRLHGHTGQVKRSGARARWK
jgi:hypothetical protein